MSTVKWNKGQLEAIEASGSSVLVSAAAGSGKTAVLVERIIRRLTDEKNPCDIEDFLIVTFTRAAAAQMKDKISRALSLKIAEDPSNRHLKECKFKLPFANISTIDSFCISLVRDNFNAAGISPDFSILDDAKLNILRRNALDRLIEEFHNERSEEFRILNETLNNTRNDSEIQEAITLLHKESRAHTFPGDYLDSLLGMYSDDTPLGETEAGKLILAKTIKKLKRLLPRIDELRVMLEEDSTGVINKYGSKLDNDERILTRILTAAESGSWDAVKDEIDSAVFDSNNKGPTKGIDKVLASFMTTARNSITAPVAKKRLDYFDYSEADFVNARERIKPVAKTLIEAVKRYGEILGEIKREENAYYYDDILHFAIGLLLKKDEEGNIVKTEIAKELSSRFKEIFVDEYQDVTAAQDSVFEALSDNDTNRFLVGDVKQCIYTFRQAMPEVFTYIRDEKPGIRKIYLNNNYRSRREITETVNFIFSRIMSKEVGDVDYDENEYLCPDMPYSPDGKIKVELDIMSDGEKPADMLKNQAYFIGRKILDAVKNKEQITQSVNPDGDDVMRDIKLSDFCILYRKKSCGKVFGEVFDEIGIPYVSDNEDTFISSPEVAFLKALLKIIDNPTDDVSLAAVMLSPVYGFTPDELALFRADGGKGPFYRCVSAAAKSGNDKAAGFIASLGKLRRIASTCSAGEFTSGIIDETGYRAVVSKMKNPSARLANINSFISLADTYEKTGTKGISAFVRFLSKLADNDVKVSSNASSAGSDCVRMMTIHKSKGLEFPVVILPDTEKEIRSLDAGKSLVISKNFGLGMKYIENNVRYKNTLWQVCSEDKIKTELSEEIRLLYVALTRAKERVIIVSNDCSALAGLEGVVPGEKSIDPDLVAEMKSYIKMLGCALLSHPDSHLLRIRSGGRYEFTEECDARIDFAEIDKAPSFENKEEKTEEIKADEKLKDGLLCEIGERLSYRYPFEALNSIRAKSTASNLGARSFDKRYFATSKPAFAMNDRLTGAQIGTAVHRFMQFCNLRNARDDLGAELIRQKESGVLSEKECEALDKKRIAGFFSTEIFERLIKSDKIYREFSFNASLPVTDIYPDVDIKEAKDETILIEGVVDCAFEENGKLVIIDFKTDRASSGEELIEEYGPQLDTYRKCMSKVLGIPVSETVIYSFALGKTVNIP